MWSNEGFTASRFRASGNRGTLLTVGNGCPRTDPRPIDFTKFEQGGPKDWPGSYPSRPHAQHRAGTLGRERPVPSGVQCPAGQQS